MKKNARNWDLKVKLALIIYINKYYDTYLAEGTILCLKEGFYKKAEKTTLVRFKFLLKNV